MATTRSRLLFAIAMIAASAGGACCAHATPTRPTVVTLLHAPQLGHPPSTFLPDSSTVGLSAGFPLYRQPRTMNPSTQVHADPKPWPTHAAMNTTSVVLWRMGSQSQLVPARWDVGKYTGLDVPASSGFQLGIPAAVPGTPCGPWNANTATSVQWLDATSTSTSTSTGTSAVDANLKPAAAASNRTASPDRARPGPFPQASPHWSPQTQAASRPQPGLDFAPGSDSESGVFGVFLNTACNPPIAGTSLSTVVISFNVDNSAGFVMPWGETVVTDALRDGHGAGGGLRWFGNVDVNFAAKPAGSNYAIYSTTSFNLHHPATGKNVWYETSLFDFHRPISDAIFLDTAGTAEGIIHGGLYGTKPSRYNKQVPGSASSSSTPWSSFRTFDFIIDADCLTRGLSDANAKYPQLDLPTKASEWAVSSVNIELEGLKDAGAAMQIKGWGIDVLPPQT